MSKLEEIKEFLAPYRPEIRELALKVRTLIFTIAPDADEQIDKSAPLLGYGFGDLMADIFCTIAPYKSWVNMGFFQGTELPDPTGLLTGTGKYHRHVTIKSAEDITNPDLRVLLQAAISAKRAG
jgi:hypothetical protein